MFTVEPDWPQAFASKGATLIAGTGYQYGDTDFVEYSERLYQEFALALREGTGAVTVGDALVRAKQTYLADTAQMRPIHEKVLLESTLFGLPMLSIDMPAGRGSRPSEASIVNSTTAFASNPGLTLGTVYTDVTVTPPITPTVKILENAVDDTAVSTLYYTGENGLVINPTEPVLPLDQFNVTVPSNVLRGVGFRGGTYTDTPDVIPLTGAATTEIRGIHTPFISTAFYPVVPWEVNYFDALVNSATSGETRLSVLPVQYLSNDIDTVDGTLRIFSDFSFRLYYNANLNSYTNVSEGIVNTPALASPPDIITVLAEEESGEVLFDIEVTGDPSAGMQEVWVTWTACDAAGLCNGLWQSIDLTQNVEESTHWEGTLPLGATPAEDIRFVVQATNGIGLVALAANNGAYYVPDLNPGEPSTPPGNITPAPAAATNLVLSGPATGIYGTNVTFSATLTSEGLPLANKPIEFGLTTQGTTVNTDANGVATVNLTLVADPITDSIRASFAGELGLAATAVSAPFTINPSATNLTIETTTPTFASNGTADLTVNLADQTGRPLREKTALLQIEDATGLLVYTESIITDLFGNVELQTVPLAAGSYDVTVTFGDIITINGSVIDLTDPRYLPSSAQLTLISNTPPTANAGGPYVVDEGSDVLLDASGSSDVNLGQTLAYAWDLDNNGTFETASVTTTVTAVNGPASLTVGLEVCDPVNECDTDSTTITVNNVSPTILNVTNNGPVDAGQPVSITVSATDPIDALTYSFDCDGDANYEVGPQSANSVNCTFAVAGTYTVNAQVSDGDDQTDDSTQVTVNATTGSPFATCGGYDVFETAPGVYDAPGFAGTLIVGTSGPDILYGSNGADLILGLEGRDDIYGRNGDDVICGGNAIDYIYGQNGNDIIFGDNQDDWLFGDNGNDTLYGGAGWDTLRGNKGDDTIYGETGFDLLIGGRGSDDLFGGPGRDDLYGDQGNDNLNGGNGNDFCRGGAGSDALESCEL